ncbi:hypothetical protein B0J17DRAFT_706558 [Rhizoctonia solani]|nr:hypothetical protein B0J17DRAFT_706558 [Rhizoctonia solani]
MSMPTPDNYITSKAKTEMPSPNANSLHQTLQGGPNVPWSPTSSTKSPIVSPAPESREPSIGPQRHSLFSNPQLYDIKRSPIVEKWKQEAERLVKAWQPRGRQGNPTKKNADAALFAARCSADRDHLNVHSGDKPHTCPFKGCNTGFATKSNMKRHFQTHRVGQLEGYRPGQTPQVMETKPGKAPRAPTATYNSKSYHNGRFRIA